MAITRKTDDGIENKVDRKKTFVRTIIVFIKFGKPKVRHYSDIPETFSQIKLVTIDKKEVNRSGNSCGQKATFVR